MQVLCKASNSPGEVCCRICGQHFLVYWARTSSAERDTTRHSIIEALAAHHAHSGSRQAHPRTGFTIPEAAGEPAFSGAALLGGAPSWSL